MSKPQSSYAELRSTLEKADFTKNPLRGVLRDLAKELGYVSSAGVRAAINRGDLRTMRRVAKAIKKINDASAAALDDIQEIPVTTDEVAA